MVVVLVVTVDFDVNDGVSYPLVPELVYWRKF